MTVCWKTSPPDVLRAHHLEDAIAREGPLPPGITVSEAAAAGGFRGGLRFAPTERPERSGVIVYFHGGGFVAGTPRSHRSLTAWLSARSGLPCLSARYRLAPEHPAPAQREDAIAAVSAALETTPPDAPFFLAGDSAGAAVALWAAMALAPVETERLGGVLLFYGAYGLLESPSIAALGSEENALDAEAIAISYARLGLPGGSWSGSDLDPFRSGPPLPRDAYLLVGDQDPLLDDTIALARHLDSCGSSAALRIVLGAEHSFLKPAGRDAVADEELRRAGDWVSARLTAFLA